MKDKFNAILAIAILLAALAGAFTIVIVIANAMSDVMGLWAGPTFIIAICIVCLLMFAIIATGSDNQDNL